MEYGEKLVAKRIWGFRGIGYPKHCFRFRIDPVPFIFNFKGNFKNWYKRPKSTQERRLSFAYEGYVRGKRKSCNLPNAWDDYQRSDNRTRKSWKNKKIRKQWMKKRV
jgi:hypothetical protein